MVVEMLSAAALVIASVAGALWGGRFLVALANEKTAGEAFSTSNRWLGIVVGALAALLVMLLTYGAEFIDVLTQFMATHAMAFSNAIIGALGYAGLADIVQLDPLIYVGIAAAVIVVVAFAREARA